MFKTLTGIHRREDLSFDQFMTHWMEVHAKLIHAHADALGIVKYIQLHRRDDPAQGKPGHLQYDGIAEVWYASEQRFRALGKSEESRAAVKKVVEDQAKFIGNETPLFKGYETKIIGP